MAGFGHNGSRSSPSALATAERHAQWMALRRKGLLERDIAYRYGVTQQAVSKAILKHVRDLPAGEAEELREAHAAYIASMHDVIDRACLRGQSDKVLLKLIGSMTRLLERQAKLLGLDAQMRNQREQRPEPKEMEPTVWNFLSQAGPTDLDTIRRIQEIDPIEKPERTKQP